MATLRNKTPFIKLNGGLNSYLDSNDIADNEAQDWQNFKSDGAKIFNRGGVTKYNAQVLAGGQKILNLYRGYSDNGSGTITKVTLAFVKSDPDNLGLSIYSINSSGVATLRQNSSSWLAPTGDLVQSIETVNGVIYIGLPTVIKKYTIATNVVGDASPMGGFYLKLHKGYLFAAGNSTSPSRIFWSGLWTPETWPATEYERVREGDGDIITGLTSFSDTLWIYKNRSIHAFAGSVFNSATPDYQLRVATDMVGCVAPRTLQTVDNFDIFLAQDGIRTWDGSGSKLLSQFKVEDIIRAIPAARVADCVGKYDPRRKWYWFAYNDPSSYPANVNNSVLIYDFNYGIWYRFQGINASSFMVWSGATDQNEMFFGSNTDGYIYQVETSNNYDSPLEKSISTFEVVSSETWTPTGTGAVDLVNYKEGIKSYKLTANNSTSTAIRTPASAIDLTKWNDNTASTTSDSIQFWVYIDDVTHVTRVGLYFDTLLGDFSTNSVWYYKLVAAGVLANGWNLISWQKSTSSTGGGGGAGSLNWANVLAIKIELVANAVGAANASFDDVRMVSAVNTVIDCYVDTKDSELENPEIAKHNKNLFIKHDTANAFNLTVTGYYDGGAKTSTIFNALTSSLPGEVLILPINRISKSVYFRFRNNTLNQATSISGFSWSFKPLTLK